MPITVKQKNGNVVGVFNTSGYIVKSSANAVVSANNAAETVQYMEISKVTWSLSPTANATISRGANLVFRCTAGEGNFDFGADNTPLEASMGDKIANCVVTIAGAGGGTVIVQLKKHSLTSVYRG